MSTIRDWQDLIAGMLALIGAGATVYVMDRQARDGRYRKRRAARAILPSTLSDIHDYTGRSIRWLDSLREKAAIAEKGGYGKGSISANTCPRPDGKMLDQLIACVEFLDKPHAEFIADMLSQIQIQHSRMAGLSDYFEFYDPINRTRVGIVEEIDAYVANSVEIFACANALFPYARAETERSPVRPALAQIENAFRTSGLDEIKNVGAYNVLTNRYKKHNAPSSGWKRLMSWLSYLDN